MLFSGVRKSFLPTHRRSVRIVSRAAIATKRILDLLGAAFGLVLLSPVLIAVGLAVRLSMGKPILFRQRRPGYEETPYEVMKFRTMTDARGSDGALIPDSERLTGLGRFLRRTSLDELPQLLNVLRGDMSLVGPRPWLMRYVPFLTPRERTRFLVRPGITGLAQVAGRNQLSWDERLELDVQYVEHWSLWQDFKILGRTVVILFSARGVEIDPESESYLDEERSKRMQAPL
jgi:sugar transferase EpsL